MEIAIDNMQERYPKWRQA